MTGPHKILFYYRFLGLGGVESVLLNRIEALKVAGLDAEYWYSDTYCADPALVSDAPYVRMVAREQVAQAALAGEFDRIVVLDNPFVLRQILRTKSHARIFAETHVPLPWKMRQFYRDMDNPGVAAVIVPSPYNKERLIEELGIASERITVVRNIVPVDAALVQHTQPQAPQLLWVGRLENEKGPDLFISLARKLSESGIDARFIMVGNDPDYEGRVGELREFAGGAALDISFIPAVARADMQKMYKDAAASGGAYVCTSRFESAPMTILEAMACGCPVVASNAGGIPLMIENRVDGELYDTETLDDAVACIRRVLSSSDHRSNMTAAARQRVGRDHSASATVAAFRNLFGCEA